ncbi:HAD family hydrolase [Gloeomargarita sp.]
MPQPSLLALDFDGVLCDGQEEYFAISAQVYRELCPDIGCTGNLEPFREWFYRLRPVITHGWEMPLLLHGLVVGEDLEVMATAWSQVQQRLLAATGWSAEMLGQRVDRTRDAWIAQDEAGWLARHHFYPGVVAQVQRWLTAAPFQPVIVTTKQERFVLALFAGAGIAWPPAWLYGKTLDQPKTAILQALHQQHKVIGFVEDRLEALTAVQQIAALRDIPLFLATWGYNTPAQAQWAAQQGIRPLTLAEFCHPDCPWLPHTDKQKQ